MMSRSVHISQKLPQTGKCAFVYQLWSQTTDMVPDYSVKFHMCYFFKKREVYLILFYLHFPPSPRQLISCWDCAWKQQEKMSCQKCISKLAIISVTCALSQCVYFLGIVCFLKIPREGSVYFGNSLEAETEHDKG